MRLEDKVALITGASSGIGKESALLFAKEGAKIVAVDVNDSGGEQTVSEIKAAGGDAIMPMQMSRVPLTLKQWLNPQNINSAN